MAHQRQTRLYTVILTALFSMRWQIYEPLIKAFKTTLVCQCVVVGQEWERHGFMGELTALLRFFQRINIELQTGWRKESQAGGS